MINFGKFIPDEKPDTIGCVMGLRVIENTFYQKSNRNNKSQSPIKLAVLLHFFISDKKE